MKSNKIENSEGKIEKVTESLWKIWWLSFYLVIVPSLVAVVGFFIYFFVGKNLYVSIGLSVITFMFVLLFFYKSYDKYRNNPFFLNKKNNLSARINIIFLVTILSLIITPIIVFLAPGDNYFELLPLISFILLYNIVYYYIFLQPIDNFDFTEEKYTHEASLSHWIKRPYNFIILFNYFVHILFLSYTFDTKISWVFPLLSNLIFYLVSRLTTVKNIKKLTDLNLGESAFLRELTIYKKKFINTILSLDFVLLIQMPFVIFFVFIFMGIPHEIIEIITISFLALILLSFYFKIRLYISSYYNKIYKRYEINDHE
jgi:hypothetical protein